MKCINCEQEMTDKDTLSCTARTVTIQGKKYKRLQYVNIMKKGDYRCHDCNVVKGGIHHFGCDMEDCPKCMGQLISCGCIK